jgi:putative transposase
LEDHGQVPPELQQQVHAVVQQTRSRSRWPARRTLAALGIPARSYYRWLREEAWSQERTAPVRPVQSYEALEEEKAAVRAFACRHTELRHRELAWRMIDEEVAYLSPSTVYRILRESNLVCPWRRRSKRRREELEQAQRPNERWGTDLMYVRIGAFQYYLVTFLDEYSRYLVHWELLTDMRGASVSLAAEGALEKERNSWEGRACLPPEIRSDNGSCYLSREFKMVLKERGLTHQLIKPHCPEENGLVERSNRTLREALEETEFTSRQEAEEELGRIIAWYNNQRLHSALGYLRPVDYYRGSPDELHMARRMKLAQARHRRRESNLKLRQPTLPLEDDHRAL